MANVSEKKKNLGGRPKEEKYKNIAEDLEKYVNESKLPILAEFAYKNNLTREYLYTLSKNDERLFNAIKKCMLKKETILEQGALTGKLNPTMAIFSLKQIGWSDHKEIEEDNVKVDELVSALNRIAKNE